MESKYFLNPKELLRNSFQKADYDIEGDCEYHHETSVAGWTTIGVGIALEVGLIIWLLTTLGEDEQSIFVED